jgi:hypothetical protein
MGMKTFMIKLTLFLGMIFTIDFALSRLLDLGRPPDYAAFIDSKKEFDHLPYVDILFIGDSETADGFVPAVFKEKLGATAFNYAVYQLSPLEGYFLLKDLLARHEPPPKLVVLGTDVQMFHYRRSEGEYTPLFIKNPLNLFPLLMESKDFGAMTLAGRKKYLFPALIKRLLNGETNSHVRREVCHIENGYLQNLKHYSDIAQFDCNKDHGFFNDRPVAGQKEYFIKTLEFIRQNDIPFVIANPPMHKNFLDGMRKKAAYHEFQATMMEIAANFGVEIFNVNHKLLLEALEDKDFLDGDHLCYSGARKFSTVFADYLLTRGFKFNEKFASLD